jgi:alpha-methylacyl-CoA racemase
MGPLNGIKIVELAGVGPAPFCAMLLADMGAEVLRVERRRAPGASAAIDILGAGMLSRGRQSIALDLKRPAAVELVLRLVERGDALIEGFRPGVMERLGLGPDACLARNPALVYGRMTGWGQHGPLAHAAGHDIDYIALSGALHAIGSPEAPSIPLNLVGDFGGGGMLLAFGVACALLEARASGLGQVVDAAMTDGAALLMTMIYQLKAIGTWSNARGANAIDGGAHFYSTYQCADGKWIAVGAIEPQFYALLLETCGIDDPRFAAQWDRARWPELRAALAEIFHTRTRDEWCALLEGTDACVAPVLDLDEAPLHPHNQARGTFVEHAGAIQPAPAPRFSRTPATLASAPAKPASPESILAAWGLGDDELSRLRERGTI